MDPCAELCVAAPRGQRAKNLDPDLLRDILGKIWISGESPDDGIDMRSMLVPEQAHGAFVALDRPSDYGGICLHGVCRMCHHLRPGWLPLAVQIVESRGTPYVRARKSELSERNSL